MHHCSPEDLALAALGEQLSAADLGHLASCSSCTAEVASLRRAVEALGGARQGAEVPLPPHVWEAIAAQTGVTAGGPAASVPAPRSGTVPPGSAPAESPPTSAPETAAVLPLTAPPRRARWLVGGAVAASLLLGIGIGAVVLPTGDEPAGSVAAARLDPLDGWEDTGAATLLDRDGRLELAVELPTPPVEDGFYEVWLLGAGSGALALGVLEGGSGAYPLPAGVDLADYGTVDVSLEPFDGDPAHSADSVARGSLR